MAYISEQELVQVEVLARAIRVEVIRALSVAGSGHTAGSLGMADIVAALYGYVLRQDPEHPDRDDRDRLILSNGHIAPVRYAAMALVGYFDLAELATLRRFGSRLQGHPERTRLPALETTSGPLGDGVSQGAGIALAGKLRNAEHRTFVLTSDAEHQCGITWEAIMFAGARKLSKLVHIIDRNGIQIGGSTEDILALEPLGQKYEAFGWHVIDVDGHNIEMVCEAIAQADSITDRPTAIVAHTIPGKGVADIEGAYEWHGKAPTPKQAEQWIKALEQRSTQLSV